MIDLQISHALEKTCTGKTFNKIQDVSTYSKELVMIMQYHQ